MIPDRANIDRVALQLTFLVTAGQTVRPGMQVKLSATQTNLNIREVQECTAITDVPMGLCNGILGDNNVLNVQGQTAFPALTKIVVTCYFHIIERALAGTGGVTFGQRVAQDPASPSHGLIAAPPFAAAGTTLTFSPGFALDTVAVDEGFGVAVMPHFFASA